MYTLERQRGDFKRRNTPNKVLNAINRKKQTNPDVFYKLTPHSKKQMKERNITTRDVVRSIEECERFYERDDKTVVEKKIGDHIVRTIYSYNMYTKEIFVISTYHINKRKFTTPQSDQFSI